MKTLETWLAEHVIGLRKLFVHTAAEKKLLKLASLPAPTTTEIRQLYKIADAERTLERGRKKAAAVTSMLRTARNKERGAARRTRTNNLIKAGELMVLAGLLNDETGLPHLDRATLVGAYMGLSNLEPDHPKFAGWKIKGQAKLDEAEPLTTNMEPEALSEMQASVMNEAIFETRSDGAIGDAIVPGEEKRPAPDSDPTDDDETSPDA